MYTFIVLLVSFVQYFFFFKFTLIFVEICSLYSPTASIRFTKILIVCVQFANLLLFYAFAPLDNDLLLVQNLRRCPCESSARVSWTKQSDKPIIAYSLPISKQLNLLITPTCVRKLTLAQSSSREPGNFWLYALWFYFSINIYYASNKFSYWYYFFSVPLCIIYTSSFKLCVIFNCPT